MILTQEQFVSRIAERTVDSKQLLSQDMKQRRNQVVDIQGVEYNRSVVTTPGFPKPIASIPIIVTPDLVYWERFAFKLNVFGASQGVSGVRIILDDIDISPYLAAQYDSWIDDVGVFPTREAEKDYDILRAASLMVADGMSGLANHMLRPGYKALGIEADHQMNVTLILSHLKYSHTNR